MTCANIVKHADDFFLRRGYKASLDDFCKEIKISKKTIYKSFRSKEELIKAIFFCRINKIASIFEPANSGENALSIVITNNIRLRDFMKPSQQRKNLTDLNKYYPDLFNEIMEEVGSLISETLTPLIKQGIKEGIFLEHLNPETVSTIYKNFYMLLRTIRTENQEMAKTMADTSFLMFIRSLLTQKGFEVYKQEKDRIEANYMIG